MRKTIAALTTSALALAAPAVADAHISLHPNTVPAGSFATLNVRVPGEVAGSYAYKVDMLLPPGFTDVNYQNEPGWTADIVTKNVSPPIQTDNGPVSQEVSQIIWTGDRTKLGRIEHGAFMQFPLSVTIPDGASGKSLGFKTLLYYSNGEVDRWIGPSSANFPTPTINVTARGGVLEDLAGAEAGPAPGELPTTATTGAPAVRSSSGGASKGLAIAALTVGITGLLAGAGGIAIARDARRASRAVG